MQALEDLRARVRSVDSRRYVDEAITAYSAGALRSAIIALWIAVVADLIEKTRTLSDGEVPAAACIPLSRRATRICSRRHLSWFEREALALSVPRDPQALRE